MRTHIFALAVAAGIVSTVDVRAQTAASTVAGDALEEVIVTAERREQDLQKTAISVVALSGESISEQGQSDARDILKNVPGVVVVATARGSAVAIRGLGFDLPPQVGESAVSMNFDGVYNARSEAATYGYFDLARVEVLRGPQSTLYGRNSTGGVVNVISNDPKQGFGVTGTLEAGNYNLIRGEGALNVPLGQSWALRAAAVSIHRNGYLSDGHNDAVGSAGRIKLQYKSGDDLAWLTTVEYDRIGGVGPGTASDAEFANGNYLIGSDVNPVLPGVQPDVGASNYYRSYRISTQVDARLGPGIMTFIPAYQYGSGYNWSATQPPFIFQKQIDPKSVQQQSAELRYASTPDSSIIWVAGLYYYDLNNVGRSFFARINAPSETTNKTRNVAVFGQVTVPLGSSIRGIAGVRQGWDRKSYTDNSEPGASPPGFDASNSDSRSALDWKLGLEADAREGSLLYLTASSGHRPGGFNILAGLGADVTPGAFYKPESLISYELGSKNRFLGERLQANGALFYYDYKDFQLADIYNFFPVLSAQFLNTDVRTLGAEIEVRAALGAGALMNIGVNYLDATIRDAVLSANPFAPPVVSKGDRVSHSPKWQVTAGLEWPIVVGGDFTVIPRADFRYVGDQYVNTANNAGNLQKAYSTGDLSLRVQPGSRKWGITAYCKNVNDKIVKLFLAGPDPQVSAPRTYGIVLNAGL